MPNVIVFDIDGVLCWQKDVELFNLDELEIDHSECPLVVFSWTEMDYIHCFVPYLDVLIDYLINAGSRIAFFSAGPECRNNIVIERLLIKLFGEERYKELKYDGQFEVFSPKDMRESIPAHGETHTHCIKDLSIVLKDNETILDSILIEDQSLYSAWDQRPCIVGLVLENLLYDLKETNFSKNAVYYLLGVFTEYFNNNPDFLPLKLWVENFFLEKNNQYSIHSQIEFNRQVCYVPQTTDPWVVNLINSGLIEVQKKYPDARLFGSQNIVTKIVPPMKLKFNI
jgi:hypothetical protein